MRLSRLIWLSVLVCLLGAAGMWLDVRRRERVGMELLLAAWQARENTNLRGAAHAWVVGDEGWVAAPASVTRQDGTVRLEYRGGPMRGDMVIGGPGRIFRRARGREGIMFCPPPPPAMNLMRFRANYLAWLEGKGRVADRSTLIVAVRSRHTRQLAERLWVDAVTRFPLRTERYDADGHLVALTVYDSVEYEPEAPPVSSDVREPTGPQEAPEPMPLAQAQEQLGFVPLVPRYVPLGYAFSGMYPYRCPLGHLSAEMRYDDGLRAMSVFQRPRGFGLGRGPGLGPMGRRNGRGPGGAGPGMRGPFRRGPMVIDRGMDKLARVFADDMIIVIVGDLTEEELLKMAESFTPPVPPQPPARP